MVMNSRGPNSDMTIMKYHQQSYPCVFHVLCTGDKDLRSEKTQSKNHNGRCRHICMYGYCMYMYAPLSLCCLLTA